MVSRHLRVLQLLVLAAVMAGCAPATIDEVVTGAGVPRDAVVRLTDDWAVAARRADNTVQVLKFERDPDSGSWSSSETAGGSPAPTSGSAHLTSQDGNTGLRWNSYFFGTAPPSVSRAAVEGLDGLGGQVVDGAWVLVFEEKGLTTDDMEWQFLDAFGNVVDSGTGIFPPGA